MELTTGWSISPDPVGHGGRETGNQVAVGKVYFAALVSDPIGFNFLPDLYV